MIRSELNDGRTAVSILCYKSFGDFVIAAASAERVDNEHGTLLLVAGDHLGDLADALDLTCPVSSTELSEPGVPAIFDLRSKGVVKGLQSLAGLRTAVKKLDAASGSFIIDRPGWRERFIVGGRNWRALPQRDNIYLAYRDLFEELGYRAKPAQNGSNSAVMPTTVGIFPGSRLAQKNLPLPLIRSILANCVRQDIIPVLYTLADERPDIEESDIPHRIVPKNFRAMVEAISGAGLVISADSMPAHIAERAKRPIFVFSPVPNTYWLPFSAFISDNWALFDTDLANDPAFEAFLSGCG